MLKGDERHATHMYIAIGALITAAPTFSPSVLTTLARLVPFWPLPLTRLWLGRVFVRGPR